MSEAKLQASKESSSYVATAVILNNKSTATEWRVTMNKKIFTALVAIACTLVLATGCSVTPHEDVMKSDPAVEQTETTANDDDSETVAEDVDKSDNQSDTDKKSDETADAETDKQSDSKSDSGSSNQSHNSGSANSSASKRIFSSWACRISSSFSFNSSVMKRSALASVCLRT